MPYGGIGKAAEGADGGLIESVFSCDEGKVHSQWLKCGHLDEKQTGSPSLTEERL